MGGNCAIAVSAGDIASIAVANTPKVLRIPAAPPAGFASRIRSGFGRILVLSCGNPNGLCAFLSAGARSRPRDRSALPGKKPEAAAHQQGGDKKAGRKSDPDAEPLHVPAEGKPEAHRKT